MPIIEVETYYPKTKQHWRKWLLKNHIQKGAVWLIMYKQSANKPTVTWSDAVDEALCFGWIDSIKKTLEFGIGITEEIETILLNIIASLKVITILPQQENQSQRVFMIHYEIMVDH